MRLKDDERWAFPQIGVLVARQQGKSSLNAVADSMGFAKWREAANPLSS
jgi:hypothetical protein